MAKGEMTRRRKRRRQRAGNRAAFLLVLSVLVAVVAGCAWLWLHRDRIQPRAQAVVVPSEYRPVILKAAGKCPEITPAVLSAQIEAESRFDPDAVSHAGARGLSQFTNDAWAMYGKDADGDGVSSPLDPGDAVDAQSRYMCALVERYKGRSMVSKTQGGVVALALAGYNAGPENVIKYNGVPPFDETMVYVGRIRDRLPAHEAAWREYTAPTTSAPAAR